MIRWLYRLADAARQRRERGIATEERARGRRGEDLAHRFLQEHGFTVIARNYRPRSGPGEIDLVACEGDALVFVEVKARSSTDFGSPDRAVDREKQRALERAAREYARRRGADWSSVRFDIVNVYLDHPPRLELIRDAFRAARTL